MLTSTSSLCVFCCFRQLCRDVLYVVQIALAALSLAVSGVEGGAPPLNTPLSGPAGPWLTQFVRSCVVSADAAVTRVSRMNG